MKQCKSCGVALPSSCFSKGKTNCKDCRASTARNKRRKKCPDCNVMFLPKGRLASRCENCYPVYRQAVNLLASSQYRAKVLGIENDLSVEWIQERLCKPCPKTGFTFVLLHKGNKGYGNKHPHSPSCDKINPTLGYTKNNVQIVCWWYNCAKQRFSDEEVLSLCKAVVMTANS